MIIPITFGSFSPIELDQSISLPVSIAARMLFSLHHQPSVGARSLKRQFFEFWESTLPILRASRDPIEAVRYVISRSETSPYSAIRPTVVLIDEFPCAFRLWNEAKCLAALDSATKRLRRLQFAMFGFNSGDLGYVWNNGNIDVQPVNEISDIDCFNDIDEKFAALEEQIKALDRKKH